MAWYIIHTFTGHENKVKLSIERRAQAQGLASKFDRILVVTEDEIGTSRGGKKQVRKQKVFPGYVFIDMDLDDETRFLVRNTSGVTGFVGPGGQPRALLPNEMTQILEQVDGEEPMISVIWNVGDVVKITNGPFADFQGTIEEVSIPKEQIRVLISLFGRDTPVTLGFDDIEKV